MCVIVEHVDSSVHNNKYASQHQPTNHSNERHIIPTFYMHSSFLLVKTFCKISVHDSIMRCVESFVFLSILEALYVMKRTLVRFLHNIIIIFLTESTIVWRRASAAGCRTWRTSPCSSWPGRSSSRSSRTSSTQSTCHLSSVGSLEYLPLVLGRFCRVPAPRPR